MPIEIPNLSLGRSNRLIACGSIQTDREDLRDFLEKGTHLITSTVKKGVKHYLLLMVGGKNNSHFHVEVALASHFSSGFLPKTNAKISEFQLVADRFLGSTINLSLTCAFPLQLKDLPENGPIRLLSINSQVAGTKVQLVEGTLAVTGSLIEEISWSLEKGSDQVTVSLETSTSCEIERDYLNDGLSLLETYCAALVLGSNS